MDTALVSMAQQFSGLPMSSLIGGPLNATATANSAMALTQTKFMLDTCFNKTEENGETVYKPIMINMSLERGVITPQYDADKKIAKAPIIEKVTTSFNLPLLTVIPLNSLAVETADVGFEMEVKSSFSEEQSEQQKTAIKAEASFEAKAGWGPVSVTVKGSASYDREDSKTHNTHYQKSNSAKYTVSVHAGQLPVPKGVNTIIEAFTKAIEPIQMPKEVQAQQPAQHN